MRCLDFVNGQGDRASNKSKADLTRLWVMGFLTGNYNKRERLELVDDMDAENKAVRAVLSKCRENPEVSMFTVTEYVASDRRRDIPTNLSNELNPSTYLCGDHADGLGGSAADVLKADLAHMWAFAYVQGYVAAQDPDTIIPIENKPAIDGAIARNCGNMRDTSYFDLVNAVAQSVKVAE